MRCTLRYIVVALIALLMAVGATPLATAQENGLSGAEAELLALINAARKDPLGTAAALGRDPEQVLADLPQLAAILVSGLPALSVDGRLNAAAQGHGADMFASGLYDTISADGRTAGDRMIAAGYFPAVAGESLGLLGFSNYVSAGTAVKRLFASMFLEELNPEREARRNILAEDVDDIGVSLVSGRWQVNGVFFNAYIAVCDVASHNTASLEWRLLAMINQARLDPLGTAASLGLEPQSILNDFPYLGTALVEGMPALTFNPNLNASAAGHTGEMFELGYFSMQSPKGDDGCIPSTALTPPAGPGRPLECEYDTYQDRILTSGYLPVVSGESLGIQRFERFMEPGDVVSRIFYYMYTAELDPANPARKNILDPNLREVGISLSLGLFPGADNGLYSSAWLVTCDFGATMLHRNELETLALVNQARQAPLKAAAAAGLDPNRVLADFPDMADALIDGVPPLTVNPKIYASASEHNRDMAVNRYYGHISIDGRTPAQRVAAQGYAAESVSEVLGKTTLAAVASTTMVANDLFENIIAGGFDPDSDNGPAAFEPQATHVGISLLLSGIRVDGEDPPPDGVDPFYLADYQSVWDLADPKPLSENPVPEVTIDPPHYHAVGSVFQDTNRNMRFDIGEGVPGIEIGAFDGAEMAAGTVTDMAGGFALPLRPGTYRVEINLPWRIDPLVRTIEIFYENMLLDVGVTVVAKENSYAAVDP